MAAELAFDLALETAQRMLSSSSRRSALEHAREQANLQSGQRAEFWDRVYEYVKVLPTTSKMNGFNGPRLEPCSKCGDPISQEQWEALPLLGHQVFPPYQDDPGEVLEMKNHACGSTLTTLEPFTAAELEAEVRVVLDDEPRLALKSARSFAIARLKSQRR